MKAKNPVISLRVPNDLYSKIEQLVQATKRSKADLLLYWVEQAVALEEWQIGEIEAGIKEADAGIFATAKEVDQVLHKWL
jgi:RHH-type rel operon transcriptional repressor/antitoxin RelB